MDAKAHGVFFSKLYSRSAAIGTLARRDLETVKAELVAS
jgi:hypothetical protein